MSHHLDTPLARQNGRLYIDDLYVFPGDHSTILIMDVNSTITGPDIQPGFHPEARYEFKVHLDGADYETLTYRLSFGERDSGGQQALAVRVLMAGEAREDTAAGQLVVKLATDAGGWRQVNRAGHPMMWPIFWPDDTDFSNPANDRHPSADLNAEGKNLADIVAAAVSANGTSADPHGYGRAVASELFPDVLPYEVGTPASYSFAVRNGRTLADNAPEVMLSLALNTAVHSGLTPSVAGSLRTESFPYVVAA
jgi:hypothetical protein